MTLTQTKARKYVLSCIDSQAYDIKTRGDKQRLQFLYDTFVKEYGFNIKRYGPVNAFREWCMGLPTVFNIVFTNYDILQLAKKWRTLSKDATKAQEDRIINNYFNLIANTAFQLFRIYKITQ